MASGCNNPRAAHHLINFLSLIPDDTVDVFIVSSSFSYLWSAQSPHFSKVLVYDANYVRDACKNVFLIVAVDVELVFLFCLLYLIKK